MAGELTDSGSLFSPAVGLVYVFNLIVGTGALTMPKAFQAAGWLLSLILVTALAFMSYLTVTFVIEAMAAANAVRKWSRRDQNKVLGEAGNVGLGQQGLRARTVVDEQPDYDETCPLLHAAHGHGQATINEEDERYYFEISERIEMGQMASLFFNNVGMVLFYLCIATYLYGDLAIYAAAIPKSLRDVACTFRSVVNHTCGNETLEDSAPCWANTGINRINAYRIFLGVFIVLAGPFLFFNVQKTKYLQVFTTLMRWLAFGMMITLAAIRLAKGQGNGTPAVANITGVPTLFGVCVYSFMCHHSLPSLATPIRDKSKMFSLFAGDYIFILIFYCILSFTGIFSFHDIEDLYTLNFQPNMCQSGAPITSVPFIQYFLALFPVFTLSTSFLISGITLRNNLKAMCLTEGRQYSFVVDRLVFPVLALVPPTIVAFITNEVDFLVSVTGAYAGAVVQYLVPAALVFCARRDVVNNMGSRAQNQHHSPFKHVFWVIFVIIWAIVSIVFVTVNHILTRQ